MRRAAAPAPVADQSGKQPQMNASEVIRPDPALTELAAFEPDVAGVEALVFVLDGALTVGAAGNGLTLAPSLIRCTPSTTMRSPSATPERTTRCPPELGPSSTRRRCTF